LNHDLRPVLQYTCTSAPNGPASNIFISGVPYVLDTYRQFSTPVYAVFSRNDRRLAMQPGEIEDIIALILSQNKTLAGYLRNRLDSLREMGSVSMNEPDEGMNLEVFNTEGLLLNDHQMETLRNSYHLKGGLSSIYCMINSYTRCFFGMDPVAVAFLIRRICKVRPGVF
jgi:hypothetical protein